MIDINFQSTDIQELKRQLDVMGVLAVAEQCDATILITEDYSAYLTQIVQSLFEINSKKLKRSSNVWSNNGICCTILGGSVKKSKVAKELWEIFTEQDELNLTDIFPYGSSPIYNEEEFIMESAQPTVE